MTTHGHQTDIGKTEQIHLALKAKRLLPAEHLVDTAYVNLPLMLNSPRDYGIELVGPMRSNASWQSHDPKAYDLSHFKVDWETQTVTCPQGKESKSWGSGTDSSGRPVFHFKFSAVECRPCPQRSLCTKCKRAPRHLMIRPKAEHFALEAIRQEQKTQEWQERYDRRVGIEGTLARGIQVLGLRQTRYIGLAKTHLQHVFTAMAVNLSRLVSWLVGEPIAQPRVSRFAALEPV